MSKWIKALEKLPPRSVPVLCFDAVNGPTIGYWGNTFDGGTEWRCQDKASKNVTYWTELPDEPGKEEAHETT